VEFGLEAGELSASSAAARARSKSRTTTALIFGSSASMRDIALSTSSREETCRSASAFTRSLAVRYASSSEAPPAAREIGAIGDNVPAAAAATSPRMNVDLFGLTFPSSLFAAASEARCSGYWFSQV